MKVIQYSGPQFRSKFFPLASAFLISASTLAHADRFTWQGDVNNNYGNERNWGQNIGNGDVPGANDNIQFPSDAQRQRIELGNSNIRTVKGVSFERPNQTNSNGNHWQLDQGVLRVRDLNNSNGGVVGWTRSPDIYLAGILQVGSDIRFGAVSTGDTNPRLILRQGDLSSSNAGFKIMHRHDVFRSEVPTSFDGTYQIEGGTLEIFHPNAFANAKVHFLEGSLLFDPLFNIATFDSLTTDDNTAVQDLGSLTLNVGSNLSSRNDETWAGGFKSNIDGGLIKGGNGVYRIEGALDEFAGRLTVTDGFLILDPSTEINGVVSATNNGAVQFESGSTITLKQLRVTNNCDVNLGDDNNGSTLTIVGTDNAEDIACEIDLDGSASAILDMNLPSHSSYNFVNLADSDPFLGELRIRGGTTKVSASGMSSATVNMLTDQGLSLVTGTSIGNLVGTGALTINHPLSFGSKNQDSDFSGALSGSSSLTKEGAGTWTYTGNANNFSGTVSVNEGILAGTGGFHSVNVSGTSTLSPGTSPGVFTAQSLTLLGTYFCEIDGTSHDQIQINGNLNLTGSTLDIRPMGSGLTEEVYVIASYGSLTGQFSNIIAPPSFTGAVSIDYSYNGNQVALVIDYPYDHWAASIGLTEGVNDGPEDDPNQDGIVNLHHFAFDSHPLGDGTSEMKLRLTHSLIEGDNYLTLTVPIRRGTTFSGNLPLTGLTDEIKYTLEANNDLDSSWNLVVEEVSPALDAGLPPLRSVSNASIPDWEYRTFRITSPLSSIQNGFIRVGVEKLP